VSENLNPQWKHHLDGIADELVHLAVACDVRLREPGVIERILKNDATVCGSKNDAGFRKLRSLLMATYDSLDKAVARLGAEETRAITDAIIERVEARRQAGRGPR